MKTAVTVLQEMMVKLGQTPDYECISQSGPQHQAMFEYRCVALEVAATGAARSKKEAKQEAARHMLRQLARRGHAVPPPYGLHDPEPDLPGVERGEPAPGGAEAGAGGAASGAAVGAAGARSYVALLKELCEEYRLPGVEYELVGDTGPPHLRHFTVRARLGQHTRLATATTKKAARQLAADQLYTYLRENLARLTEDFVEEEALVRAHEKAMERYLETREEARRPDLGQKIADYHLGLTTHSEPEAQARAVQELQSGAGAGAEARAELERALAALGLQASEAELPREQGPALHVLQVPDAAPPLAFAGPSRADARAAALRYLRRALRPATTTTPATTAASTTPGLVF